MDATAPPLVADSMAEVLLTYADRTPDALAFGFLIDGEHEGPRLTYAELDREARAVAAALRDVAGPGDRALLVYAPGLAFVSAFFGCQYAGVVPVPVYPPRPGQLAQGWQVLRHIAADCTPRAILADRAVAPFLPTDGAVPALAGLPLIVTDRLDPVGATQGRPAATGGDDLALLQYTSGSTADPKGVMVTHRNLLHNLATLQTVFDAPPPGAGVCWLPPYHDMGLIGGLLQTVYRGAACWVMSPVALLQDPIRWLRALSRYRAEVSGGPNFAFDMCVQRSTPQQRVGLDLSHWTVAAIGAEPVDPRILDRFTAAFAPAGFRPETFYPCYGLAESTVFVTGGARTARPVVRYWDAAELERGRSVPVAPAAPNARVIVGCGRAWMGQEVRVADPAVRVPVADGTVGEIWVAGPSVARGYWARPTETADTFGGRLAGADGGPYLRTGDLGFVRDGELFITGRIKELIVVRGRNYYPHDIEATVQAAHPDFRPGCCAAFEVTRDGQARVVVVQEVDRRCRAVDAAALTGDIRQAVAERHGLQVYDAVLLEYGSIPKTSSGKVRRVQCRADYQNGELRAWKSRPA